MKPDLQATPVIPFCNSIAPTAYACSTGQEDKPLPTALKLQQSFLAMIFSLFPKSWRKEFLSLLMPTSCRVLAALSILCTHAAWVLSQRQLCFGPCSSNSIFCKLLREDLIPNSLKKSKHTGGSAAWSALKESWRRFCAACITSQGQGGRAHTAALKAQRHSWIECICQLAHWPFPRALYMATSNSFPKLHPHEV